MNDLVVANDNGSGTEVVVRDHSEPMSIAEFASWMEQNVAGSIADALSQAAFMLCCDVISQDIAKAPLRLRRRTSPTTSEIVMPAEHPIAAMLAMEPNRRHTWPEYTEMSVYWECLTSNSYSVVLRDRVDNPVELIPVQTGRIRELVEGRDIFYDVTAATQQEQALLGAPSMRVPERDMVHVRSRMLDGLDGYSTLEAGKKTLDAGKAIERFRESLFGEEGQMRGVFKRTGVVDETMPDAAFQRLRQQYKTMMNRFRQITEPILLEGGIEFESISSKPHEMELTKQLSAQIIATCRLMRVPPHKVFELEGAKYENLETQEKMYVGDALVPRCERREARMAKVLLTRKERMTYFLEYDRDAMALRDSQRENERVKTLVERGVITIDEARARMGYNALPNDQGKARLIPTNMTLVDEDGNVIVAGSSTAKPDAGKEETTPPAEEPTKGLRLVQ